jgi:methylglutaconyl-CoA hydratase
VKTIRVSPPGPIVTVTLARPEVRNAFDETVIAELSSAFGSLPKETRVVVLTGEGTAFCSGADAAWMRKSQSFTPEENAADSGRMAAMLRAIDECPCPVLARVNGAALGGGMGLVAASDIAIAQEGASFGFTEVRLGLVPAVISTFVLPRIGARAARRYFLTGERFGAREAREIGLVQEVVAPEALDARVAALASGLLECGPQAIATAKRLIRDSGSWSRDQAIAETIRILSQVRVSPEAQEGLSAFLEKRKPKWS